MQVLRTTVGVPTLPGDALVRPRLLGALYEGLSRRVLLIVAEAGYGKTTLLSQFARTLDWPVAWYTVTEDGRDPSTFLASIVAAVEMVRPGTTFTTNQVLSSLTDASRAWRSAANALINDLAGSAPDPMLIVLDDLHVVDGEIPADIAGYLAEHLPAPVRLALISRTRPRSAEIARLAGQGQTLTMDAGALAFNPHEVSLLLQNAGDPPMLEEDAALAHAHTEGWPLGLHLLQQAHKMEGRPVVIDAVRGHAPGRRELYDFFSTQILDRLPAKIRRFLLRVSILDPIECDVAAAVTNMPDAHRVLQDLVERGLFVTSLHTEEKRYRLHPLFRETLQAHLERTEAPKEIGRLHLEAGRFLAETDRAADAIPFLLRAGDLQVVVRHLEAHGERWIQEGRAKSVVGWIEQLPREIVEQRPVLLMLQGYHQADVARDWERALQLFSTAAAQATGDLAGYARYGEASCLFRLGRFDEAGAICRAGLALYDLSPRPRARLHRRLGASNLLSGRPQDAAPRYEEALRLFEEVGDRAGQVQVLQELAYLGSHLQPGTGWTGRLLARLMPLHSGAEHLAMRTDAAQAIAQLLYEEGRYAKALVYLEESRQGAKLLDDVFRKVACAYYRGLTLSAMARVDEAKEAYLESVGYAEGHQASELGLGPRLGLALLTRDEGRPGDAAALLRGILDDCRRTGAALFVPSVQMDLAFALVEDGDVEGARACFQEARQRFLEWNAERRAADCALHLAALDLRRSSGNSAAAGLAEAMAGARKHHLDHRFGGHQALLGPLLAQALRDGLEIEYAGKICAQIGSVAPVLPLLTDRNSAVRLRVVDVAKLTGGEEGQRALGSLSKDRDAEVRALAKEALVVLSRRPPAPLRIRLLGGFEVRKRELLLSPSLWRRKRDRLLFAYLLLARDPVPREALLEALWPDLPPDSAGASLNVAWSGVKRALEPALPEGVPSSYVMVGGGRYGLGWTAINIDIAEFEGQIALAGRAATLDARVSHLQSAVDLYRGDLLPDDASQPWTVVERERLRSDYLSVLDRLAEGRSQQGRPEEAAEVLRVALRLEPWREEAYRGLMRFLAGMGRRSEALHLYRQCEALLRKELNVSPSAETFALFEAIAAGQPR